MIKHAVFIVPHRLNFGPSFAGTPSRAGKELVQTVGQGKTSTVGEIHFGKGGKKTIIAHVFQGLDFGKCLTDHILKKGNGLLVHALMNSFRRDCHILVQLRDLCRQLCQGRLGLTPGPKGHEGQKEVSPQ